MGKPAWFGGMQDLSREHGFERLRVTGALPSALAGTLYRNGPAKFGVAGKRYGHWFDGDGGLSAVRFEGGHALGAARITRTEGLLREMRAKKRLFGGYDTGCVRPFREVFGKDQKNTANTSVLLWQQRLFATCEAGKPYELDPKDIAPLGETDLDVITATFSAHPHYVPSRRTTYNFGLGRAKNTTATLYALPDEGAARALTSFPIEGIRLNHDFAVTDRFAVFMFAPAYMSLFRTLMKKPMVSNAKWRAEQGTEVVVVPLDAPHEIRRMRADAFLAEHVVNAWDDGDAIAIDYTHYDTAEGLEGFARGLIQARIDAPLLSTIRRARVDPKAGTFRSEEILGRAVELPTVAPAKLAVRHRFAYYVSGGATVPFEAILKHDLESGTVASYTPGADMIPGEAVFVPRPGATTEDDGWLLTLVYDGRSDTSRLDILDARGVGDGPIAACHFDHPIPLGFHGLFAPSA